MTSTNQNSSAGRNQPDPAALRELITHPRQELGQTVQDLAARADIPARARQQAQFTAERVRQVGQSPTPWLVLGISAAAITVIAILNRIRRRRQL